MCVCVCERERENERETHEAGWATGPVWTGGKSRRHRDYEAISVKYYEREREIVCVSGVCVCVCVCAVCVREKVRERDTQNLSSPTLPIADTTWAALRSKASHGTAKRRPIADNCKWAVTQIVRAAH